MIMTGDELLEAYGEWAEKQTKNKKGLLPRGFPFGTKERVTPTSTKNTAYTYPGTSQEPIPELYLKPFDAEGMMGKYIAYAEIRIGDVTKEGLLFVRKCGAWKLIDPYSFLKGASGSEGSISSVVVTIHYMIYEEKEEVPHEKPRNNVKPIPNGMDLDIIDMLGSV